MTPNTPNAAERPSGKPLPWLIDRWRTQAKECRQMAEQLGERHSTHMELLRDAAQYEQCAGQVERSIASQHPAESVSADYPECSGDPACCPENEGFGCCKPNPQPSTPGAVSDEWSPTIDDMPEGICVAKRIHVERSRHMDNWFVGFGKDESCQIEGTANHWYWLAYALLGLVDEKDSPYSEDKPLPFSPAYIRAALESFAKRSAEAKERDTTTVFLADVEAELRHARAKFPGDRIMTIALAEEFGELAKAVLDEPSAHVYKEAVQTAVMAARVVIDGDSSVNEWRAAKGLDGLTDASRSAAK